MNTNRSYLQVVNNQTSISMISIDITNNKPINTINNKHIDNINDKYTKAFKKYDYVNMNYFYKNKKNQKVKNIYEQLDIKINPNLKIRRMTNKEKNLFQKLFHL